MKPQATSKALNLYGKFRRPGPRPKPQQSPHSQRRVLDGLEKGRPGHALFPSKLPVQERDLLLLGLSAAQPVKRTAPCAKFRVLER